MAQFSVQAASMHLPELIEKALLGEEILIQQNHRPMVKIVPLQVKPRKRQLGSAKGLLEVAADFDAPLEDFKDYV